jgi:hypothetical protein
MLLNLAERCEAASGPDRVLNRAIARAVGWGYQTPSEAGRKNPAWFHPNDCRDGKPVLDSLHGTDVWREPLDYVASLDAAVALVPEGCTWELSTDFSPPHAGIYIDLGDEPQCQADAATPALALTAASLRARASGATDDQ